MAEQEAKDNASRQRIISHMNQDHADSIILFLQHYCEVPSWKAYKGRMSNINLDEMAFVCSGNTYRIPLNPPMTSFREARERAVQMDKESRQALRKSDITVKEFRPPQGIFVLVFAVIAATFLAYSQRWWFGKGQIVEHYLGSTFARISWTIQPWLISAMLCIHSAELVYFIRNRLERHGVNVRALLWWQWVIFTFVEGQLAFKRFDDLVRAKTEEKEKQKH